MKKLPVLLLFLLFPSSCELFNKLSVTCNGDCDDPSFKIEGESGSSVTYSNFNNQISYDQYGQVSKVTFSGTVTYNDSGNSYHVEGVANHSPCNYNLTVTDGEGNESSCSN